MKLSDVRISNIKELQAFLTESGVEFEADANKPKLQELARNFIESQKDEEATSSNTAETADEGDDTEHGAEKPKVKTAEEIAEEERIAAEEKAVLDARRKEEQEIAAAARKEEDDKEAERVKSAEEAKAKKDAEKAEAEKKAATPKPTKVKHDEIGTPGDRRNSTLEDLLKELSVKGFENKQQLADLLEAEVREGKALEAAKKEHAAREEAIFQGEMKLDQRIRDNEKEMAQVLVHRKQCEDMLAKAVALNERNRRG